MKIFGCLLFTVVFLFAFSAPVFAGDTLMEDLFERADLDRLEEVLPSDLPMREELISGVKNGEEMTSQNYFRGLFTSVFHSAMNAFSGEVTLFASLFCVLVLSAFFSAMSLSWFRDSVRDAVDFLSALVLAGVSYHGLYSLFVTVGETLTTFTSFLSSMLPITGAVYSLSGGVVSSTVQSSLFLSALTVLESLSSEYLLPLLCASFALSAAGAVSAVNFSSLSRFLRRVVMFCISALFLVLLAILSVQTLLSASADSLALRSARFAAANFVPAVGGMFSESAKTVFSAMHVLRGSIGFLGVFCVLWIVLVPLFLVLVRQALFRLLSAFAECFSLEREGAFLSDCAQTLSILNAVVLSGGVFFLLGFGIFIAVPIGG
ncbi:MAG: hypothetical protein J6J21_04240 [Clostridia bacterium]|nr:hypothetical protein [Clostridia bacterium]